VRKKSDIPAGERGRRQAMRELIQQAGENDNISTLYVTDDDGKFYGELAYIC